VDATGFVVYAQVVKDVVKKFGITSPTLSARAGQNVSTINKVLALLDGRIPRTARWHHRRFDVFKQRAPLVIRAGEEIELWARVCASRGEMLALDCGSYHASAGVDERGAALTLEWSIRRFTVEAGSLRASRTSHPCSKSVLGVALAYGWSMQLSHGAPSSLRKCDMPRPMTQRYASPQPSRTSAP
jgi:hypothetical protein